MSEHRQPRSYHLARPDGIGFLRQWSARQAAVGFVGLFLALSSLRLRTDLALRIVMIVLGMTVLGLGLGRAPGGEPLLDLALPFGRYLGRGLARRRHWAAPVVLPGNDRRAAVPPMFHGLALYELDPVAEFGRPGARVGLLEDRADGTLTVVFRVHGIGFAVADADEKDVRLARWGQTLAAFCRERHPVTRLAWSHWCAPAGLEEHRLWLAEAMRPDSVPEMVAAYEQVLEQVGRSANRSATLLTLSISTARVKPLPHHGGDRLLAAAERLLEEADLVSRQLRRADLVVGGPLSAAQIARSIRERLDPTCMAVLDTRGRALGEAAGLVSPANAYPLVTEEERTFLRCDNSFHRAFRVAEWPRSGVRADWLRDFLGMAGAVRTLSVTYHPQSRRQSRWEVDAQASRTEGTIEERTHKNHHVGASLRRASAAIEQIDEELELGAGMEHLTGLVIVTAASAEGLEYAAERVRQVGANAGIELRQLDCRHGAALLASLPIGRGVREGGRA